VLVGNKSDKPRDVQLNVAENLARDYNMLFYETSAHSNENIDLFFQDLVKAVYRRKDIFPCGCQENKKVKRATSPLPSPSCCKIN